MCANFQVIGVFAFKKDVQISSNFLHFEPKKEHLECGRPIRRIFLFAGCFFHEFKAPFEHEVMPPALSASTLSSDVSCRIFLFAAYFFF